MIKKNLKKLFCGATALSAIFLPTAALADGVIKFYLEGDTYGSTYKLGNESTSNESVLAFGMELISPYLFDTVYGPPGEGSPRPFDPLNPEEVGYTGPSSFADGTTRLDFTFDNFTPGKVFEWDIDVDTPTKTSVYANELIGSTAYVDFSNGLRGTGMLEAVTGEPLATQLVIRAFAPTPGVPEPATWAMLLAGFGMVGASIRTRRKNVGIPSVA